MKGGRPPDCGLEGDFLVLNDASLESLVKDILRVDFVVVGTECGGENASLIAFLAKLLGKKVYWVGRRPEGILGSLVDSPLE